MIKVLLELCVQAIPQWQFEVQLSCKGSLGRGVHWRDLRNKVVDDVVDQTSAHLVDETRKPSMVLIAILPNLTQAVDVARFDAQECNLAVQIIRSLSVSCTL